MVHKYTLLAKLVNSKHGGNYSALKLWSFWTHVADLWHTRGWKLWKKEFILPPCEFMNTYKDQLPIADCINRNPRKLKIGIIVPIAADVG
jgi:hypothetical protein